MKTRMMMMMVVVRTHLIQISFCKRTQYFQKIYLYCPKVGK